MGVRRGRVRTEILGEHGVEPDGVRDVDAAWAAFGAFLQVEIEGIGPPGNDGAELPRVGGPGCP
ncbi:hypothetical protein [Streptomyces sp. NPDC001056]